MTREHNPALSVKAPLQKLGFAALQVARLIQARFGSGVHSRTTLSTRQKSLRKQTESLQRGKRRMCAMFCREHVQQRAVYVSSNLFDYLVGAGENRWRDGQAERFRGFEIDHELGSGRLLKRQISRLLTLKYSSSVDTHL